MNDPERGKEEGKKRDESRNENCRNDQKERDRCCYDEREGRTRKRILLMGEGKKIDTVIH